MSHISEYEVEARFIERLESLGYTFAPLNNYDDVLANFRLELSKFNAAKLIEAKGEASFTDAEFKRVLIHVENKSVYESAKILRDKYVLTLDNGKTVYLEVNDFTTERYITNISWSPDSRSLYAQILDRSQHHAKLNQYSAATGNFVRTLLTEDNEAWVEPLNPIYFIKGRTNLFLYRTDNRDGFRNLYLVDTLGTLRRRVMAIYGQARTSDRLQEALEKGVLTREDMEKAAENILRLILRVD
jgi:hypothetical protein